ncbi:MAG: PIG-L family deacetylase [Desulfobacteraceae bacterium]|nr:PIG-L family deacetylase [Desulfobacteraceae bacterium]
MKLMAVMAHPDDAEIWCGATLILHSEKGDTVRICSLSYTGESTRGQEAYKGAKRIGCEVELLGLDDTAIRDTDEAAEQLRRSIDSFRPDTIITHWFDDMHPDHEATFRVLRRALICGFLGKSIDALKTTPRIFCCDTYNSIGFHGPFKPDRFVDVTHIWKKKETAIKAHESQLLSLYMDMIDRQCLSHGKAAGTKRAEGFLYLPLFGRPDDGAPLGG